MRKCSGNARLVKIIVFSLILLSGCATCWDRQRQQLHRSFKQGEINEDNYNFLTRKVDTEEKIFLEQSQGDKVLQQQAKQKQAEGYYIPPSQADNASGKQKNCSAKCDYYGNCETVCE
jgi:hypothetical protein